MIVLLNIRGSSLPLCLGLFEEVLPPFCLIQEYICLWGQGQGRNIGGSGGIPVSSKWTNTTSTILMRRQSKRGLRASKYSCSVITSQDADRKRNWCRSLVGEAGNSIIEKLPQAATWAEVKEELCSVLGEGNPKKRAFDVLQNYKPKGKGLGEMATDIMAKASLATSDADLQVQLGLKAFLQAVPRNIGLELRRRHFVSVKEALKEARFLQAVLEEDEDHESRKVFKGKEEVKPVKEPKVDLNRVVEACIRKLQTLQACKKAKRAAGVCKEAKKVLVLWTKGAPSKGMSTCSAKSEG